MTYVKLFCVLEPKQIWLSKVPKQKSPLIRDQMIQDLGVKKDLFEVLAKKYIIWDHSWLALAWQPYTVPVSRALETLFQLQLCSFFVTQWIFFCSFFLFYLINAGFFWQLVCIKNVTAWLRVTHESQASSGLFSTFNGSLRLAFSENKSKQVSFVLGLIDPAQWAE